MGRLVAMAIAMTHGDGARTGGGCAVPAAVVLYLLSRVDILGLGV